MTAAASVTTDVDGIAFHSVEAGEPGAPPLLLLHGLGASVTRWTDVVPVFAERYRTIALDLPGFGRSDAPRARYSTAWLAGGVRAFCARRGIDRPAVVGNSLGGLVALRYAASGGCSALVLVGAALPQVRATRPPIRTIVQYALPAVPIVGELMYETYMRLPPERRLRDSLTNICSDPSRVSEATRRVLLDEFRERPGGAAMRRSLLSAQRAIIRDLTVGKDEVWRLAAGLSVPTLVLWGEHDRVVRVEVGRHAAAVIPGAQLVVLDAGHTPQMELPGMFADAVDTFLVNASKASRSARG